jgi:hypothetical protein
MTEATDMEAKILSCPDGLSNKQPSLRKAIDGAQEGGHENEALDMCGLDRCMTNIM